jgi:hypothetical protein
VVVPAALIDASVGQSHMCYQYCLWYFNSELQGNVYVLLQCTEWRSEVVDEWRTSCLCSWCSRWCRAARSMIV